MPTKRILVIESEEDFAQSLVSAFSRFDAEVTVIADGKQGLQTAKADPPDLILLRVELPRMSGYSICNKLKKDKKLKAVPLVIMSSEATDETFEQHRKLKTRAEEYIIKPFNDEDLLSKTRVLMDLDELIEPEKDETIVLDDDDAIALDDDEAIVLDDDEAFSLDEIEELGDVDEDIDLGEGDSTVVMESPLSPLEALEEAELEETDPGLEKFDDVFAEIQVRDDGGVARETDVDPAPEEPGEEIADFDDVLESLEEVQAADDMVLEEAGDEEVDDLDLSTLDDLGLPDEGESLGTVDELAPAEDEAIEDELLAGLEMAGPAEPAKEDEEPEEFATDLEPEPADIIDIGADVEPVSKEEAIPETDVLLEEELLFEPPPEPEIEPAPEPELEAAPEPETDIQMDAEPEPAAPSVEEPAAEPAEEEDSILRGKKEFLALRSTINAKDREIIEFKEEINKKDQEILEVEEKTVERESEIAKLQQTLASRDRDLKEQTDKFDDLRRQKNELDELHAANMAEWEERYTKETAELEHKLQTVDEEHREELGDAEKQVEQAKAELEDAIQRHSDEVFGLRARSKQERESLQEQISGLQGELETSKQLYEQECTAHEETRHEVESDFESARSDVADLEQKVSELQASAAEHEDRVVQAYQKIKNDEKLKEKARKAVEIAFTLLADEVSTEGDAEGAGDQEAADEAHT